MKFLCAHENSPCGLFKSWIICCSKSLHSVSQFVNNKLFHFGGFFTRACWVQRFGVEHGALAKIRKKNPRFAGMSTKNKQSEELRIYSYIINNLLALFIRLYSYFHKLTQSPVFCPDDYSFEKNNLNISLHTLKISNFFAERKITCIRV